MTNRGGGAAAMSRHNAYRPIWAKRKKTEFIARHFFKNGAARLLGTNDQIKLWALVQVRISVAVEHHIKTNGLGVRFPYETEAMKAVKSSLVDGMGPYAVQDDDEPFPKRLMDMLDAMESLDLLHKLDTRLIR
ncbi:hypothetical protein PG996_006206 [Apiospora saccharicola]|uniref:Uncharacterized protein n=1 Tax=Apiospora saccharicola TaxID=335842 RepID=A0ABR1VSQ3_9PEZI